MEGMETASQLLNSCYRDFLPIVLSAIKHIQFIQASVNFNEDLKFVNELITSVLRCCENIPYIRQELFNSIFDVIKNLPTVVYRPPNGST